MQGRFTATDPLLSTGYPGAPQSWNRYSYTLNNPLGLIDPTGMFVIDPNLSTDDQDKIKAAYNNLKTSLNNYKVGSADYKRIQRALSKLGGIGVNNGVTVTVGNLSGKSGGKAIPTAINNMGKQNARVEVTITLNRNDIDRHDAVFVGGVLGHEATHAADFDVLARTYKGKATVEDFLTAFDRIRYQSEFNAYMAEGAVNQAGNPTKERGYWVDNPPTPQGQLSFTRLSLWNPAWAKLDAAKIEENRAANVKSFLTWPKSQGGYYELKPPK
jgi:hypothetical protein